MYKYFFKYILVTFLLFGCNVKSAKVENSQIVQLSVLLRSLDGDISQKESMKLSKDIFDITEKLTKEFKLTSPPLWHNFLVNIGFRKQGLCYHWSDKLYVYLKQKQYSHFSIHLLGANIGEYFFEHNALVIVAKGSLSLKNGILIDPWRNSGKLYFSKVSEDKKYTWKHRTDRGCFP